ncbi:MAG: PKD domain-containing protein, partial [Actinomycetia bacterium]|nr:PKD domain-containing protein [Actinomycetes bacterium]
EGGDGFAMLAWARPLVDPSAGILIASMVMDYIKAHTPISPKVGDPVQFTDTSTGNPTWREWDFGDGHRSTQVNPIHTFEVPGTMARICMQPITSASRQDSSYSVVPPSIALSSATHSSRAKPIVVAAMT